MRDGTIINWKMISYERFIVDEYCNRNCLMAVSLLGDDGMIANVTHLYRLIVIYVITNSILKNHYMQGNATWFLYQQGRDCVKNVQIVQMMLNLIIALFTYIICLYVPCKYIFFMLEHDNVWV